jgi:PAS domain S-box-containing protein
MKQRGEARRLRKAGAKAGDGKRALRQLAEIEAFYIAAPKGLCMLDRDLRYVRINQRLADINGASREAHIGKTIREMVPDLHPETELRLRQVIETGLPVLDVELTAQAPGKPEETRTRLEQWCPYKNSRGKVLGLNIEVEDISERKKIEACLRETSGELVRSNNDLEQFACVVSHELQEPLRMVTGFCGLLKEQFEGKLDVSADQYLSLAVDGAQRMQALIQALLVYSRVGNPGDPVLPVRVEDALRAALDNLKDSIGDAGARITAEPLPTVPGNAQHLAQVFQNLIGNALKYRAKTAPEVHVSAKREGREWLFSVRDNGIGFDPLDAGKIFTMFHRLHTREEYPGTGIGLAICRKIIDRHGGRIWADSQPGLGATFSFTLPCGTTESG